MGWTGYAINGETKMERMEEALRQELRGCTIYAKHIVASASAWGCHTAYAVFSINGQDRVLAEKFLIQDCKADDYGDHEVLIKGIEGINATAGESFGHRLPKPIKHAIQAYGQAGSRAA